MAPGLESMCFSEGVKMVPQISSEPSPAGRIISVPTSEWRNWQTR